ncbi:MAG: ATP-binding protein, partial [Saprospiraceae bacterium]
MLFTLDTSNPMAPTASEATNASVDTPTILLIEDNMADATIVEILLEESENINCRIDHQMTLGQGLEALAGNIEYDAVLLDMNLPDSRGFETLTRVLEKFPDDNVILLTGTKDREIGFKAVELGAQDYLVKGEFDSDELAKSLRFSIERKKVIKRLAQMQRLAQTGNWEFRPNDNYFFASPEALRIVGAEGGLNLFDQVQQPDSPFHIITQWLKNNNEGNGCSCTEEISFELDGVKRFALIEGNHSEVDGKISCQGIIQDITDRRVGEELRKAHELSQRSAKMKEQFVASISHEMRTPMNAILGMSNILIQMDLEEEQHGLVNSIKQSSEILLGVVNDILEISTLQNGKIVFENTMIDINELVDNLFDVMQYKLQEKDLLFERTMPDDLPNLLIGDKLRLNQVLYNLVGNSIKFTDTGAVGLHLEVLEKTATDVNLKFSISDTGIGIPADKVDTVFGSFTRVRTKDRIFEGTGLGLSIAKNIVEQLDGKIGATSVLGEGSTFSFTMRFGIGSADAEAAPPTEREYEIDPNRPIRLLLAEDHKMNQLVARKTIERAYPNIDLTIV